MIFKFFVALFFGLFYLAPSLVLICNLLLYDDSMYKRVKKDLSVIPTPSFHHCKVCYKP